MVVFEFSSSLLKRLMSLWSLGYKLRLWRVEVMNQNREKSLAHCCSVWLPYWVKIIIRLRISVASKNTITSVALRTWSPCLLTGIPGQVTECSDNGQAHSHFWKYTGTWQASLWWHGLIEVCRFLCLRPCTVARTTLVKLLRHPGFPLVCCVPTGEVLIPCGCYNRTLWVLT